MSNKHKEVELYEAFFTSAQGEGSSHVSTHESMNELTSSLKDDECDCPSCQSCQATLKQDVEDLLEDSKGG